MYINIYIQLYIYILPLDVSSGINSERRNPTSTSLVIGALLVGVFIRENNLAEPNPHDA